MHRLLAPLLVLALAAPARAQAFVAALEADDLPMLARKPAILVRTTGEVLTGRYDGATLINGYMSTVRFKPDSGETLRIKPEEIARLSIRPSKAVKFEMATDAASSIGELAGADFDEIAAREFIIFEPARRANRAGTMRLMQLLNPGFDSLVKVFADPNAKKTQGLSVSGVRLLGGEDKSYLFLLAGDKTVVVRKRGYDGNFAEIYGGCAAMVATFAGERMRWSDVAAHVFVYDRICR